MPEKIVDPETPEVNDEPICPRCDGTGTVEVYRRGDLEERPCPMCRPQDPGPDNRCEAGMCFHEDCPV